MAKEFTRRIRRVGNIDTVPHTSTIVGDIVVEQDKRGYLRIDKLHKPITFPAVDHKTQNSVDIEENHDGSFINMKNGQNPKISYQNVLSNTGINELLQSLPYESGRIVDNDHAEISVYKQPDGVNYTNNNVINFVNDNYNSISSYFDNQNHYELKNGVDGINEALTSGSGSFNRTVNNNDLTSSMSNTKSSIKKNINSNNSLDVSINHANGNHLNYSYDSDGNPTLDTDNQTETYLKNWFWNGLTLDWSKLTNVPTDLTNGDNSVDWNNIKNIPASLDVSGKVDWNNVENVPTSITNPSADWNTLKNVPQAINNIAKNGENSDPLEYVPISQLVQDNFNEQVHAVVRNHILYLSFNTYINFKSNTVQSINDGTGNYTNVDTWIGSEVFKSGFNDVCTNTLNTENDSYIDLYPMNMNQDNQYYKASLTLNNGKVLVQSANESGSGSYIPDGQYILNFNQFYILQ